MALRELHSNVLYAACQAYVSARRQGSADAGDVLLDMSQALLQFDYRDTFVNAFDVRRLAKHTLTLACFLRKQ